MSGEPYRVMVEPKLAGRWRVGYYGRASMNIVDWWGPEIEIGKRWRPTVKGAHRAALRMIKKYRRVTARDRKRWTRCTAFAMERDAE